MLRLINRSQLFFRIKNQQQSMLFLRGHIQSTKALKEEKSEVRPEGCLIHN